MATVSSKQIPKKYTCVFVMTYTFVYNICDGREMLDYWHNDRRSRILASACDKIGDGVCKILMTC